MTQYKRRRSAIHVRGIVGMILATIAVLAAAAPAEAAPAGGRVDSHIAAHADDPAAALLDCWATPGPGIDAVNVRRSPSTSSGRIGIMYQGQSADADCNIVNGGPYTACLGGGTEWVRVIWAGAYGYVALWCVTLYND